jgi:hypothetical protein
MNFHLRKSVLWPIVFVLLGLPTLAQDISTSQLPNDVDQSRERNVVIPKLEGYPTFSDDCGAR